MKKANIKECYDKEKLELNDIYNPWSYLNLGLVTSLLYDIAFIKNMKKIDKGFLLNAKSVLDIGFGGRGFLNKFQNGVLWQGRC